MGSIHRSHPLCAKELINCSPCRSFFSCFTHLTESVDWTNFKIGPTLVRFRPGKSGLAVGSPLGREFANTGTRRTLVSPSQAVRGRSAADTFVRRSCDSLIAIIAKFAGMHFVSGSHKPLCVVADRAKRDTGNADRTSEARLASGFRIIWNFPRVADEACGRLRRTPFSCLAICARS